MGYTHYWYRVQELPVDKFKAFIKDAQVIVDAIRKSNIALAWEGGERNKVPELTGDTIQFNGVGDEAYETFRIPRIYDGDTQEEKLKFDFCKTENRPYDIAVTTVLVAAKHHLGDDFVVRSDGDDDEWQEARDTVQKLLGYGEDFAVDRGDKAP